MKKTRLGFTVLTAVLTVGLLTGCTSEGVGESETVTPSASPSPEETYTPGTLEVFPEDFEGVDTIPSEGFAWDVAEDKENGIYQATTNATPEQSAMVVQWFETTFGDKEIMQQDVDGNKLYYVLAESRSVTLSVVSGPDGDFVTIVYTPQG